MDMNNKPYIGDDVVKIIMLQVLPGKEEDVAKFYTGHFEEYKKEKGHTFPYGIYKAFGQYDLFIVCSTPYYQYFLSRIGTIPYILKSNTVLCFPWNFPITNDNGCYHTLEEKLKKKVLGLTFIKIEPGLINERGISVEQELISKCFIRDDLSVLGGIGWNEIVLLVHSDTIGDVYKFLLNMCNSRKAREDASYQYLLHKTLSFLSIDFSLVKGISDQSSLQPLYDAFTEKIQEKFFPSFNITCYPEYLDELGKKGESFFGKASYLLGSEDMRFDVITGTWGEFIGNVYTFRKNNEGKIYSTAIMINQNCIECNSSCGTDSKTMQSMNKSVEIITLSAEEIDIILKLHKEEVAKLLINTIYTFNGIIQNSIARDAFIDMLPFVRFVKDNAMIEKKPTKLISSLVDRIIFGAQQRASSTFTAITDTEYRFSPFKGGIQRVLQAIELLPCKMLADFGSSWKGIVNAGDAKTYKADLLLLNIPMNCLFKPTKWWGLFHEIGHIVTYASKEFFDQDDDEVKIYLLPFSESHISWLKYEELLGEVLSDIYAYVFGFVLDIETNRKMVTSYLVDEPRAKSLNKDVLKSEKYLFRLHAVNLFHEAYRDNAFNELSDPKRIKHSIEGLINNDVYANFKKAIIGEYKEDKMDIYLSHFSYLLVYCNNKLSKYRELINDKKEYSNSEEVDSILGQLKKGYVYEGEIKYPEVLIYRYTKDEINDYKSDIALIMTFWNIYIKQWSNHNTA